MESHDFATGFFSVNFKPCVSQSRCRDGAVVRALASYQCGPGLIPRLGVICGLSLLVLCSARTERFSLGTPVSPLLKNQNLI